MACVKGVGEVRANKVFIFLWTILRATFVFLLGATDGIKRKYHGKNRLSK